MAATSPRPDALTIPAPTPGLLRLLGLVRRPMPLSELRPAAAEAGLDEAELEAAMAVATRRQVIGLSLIAGTACVTRRAGR
jgi:hypothetical protein